jgi:hypothetical protein
MMAGSDCGFGTFSGYGKLDPYMPLHVVQEIARNG